MLFTERLHLLSPTDVSAQAVLRYELVNREHFEPWVPHRDATWFELSAQTHRLAMEDEEQRAARSYRFYIALRSEPQRVIGDAGLSNLVRGAFHSAYLGYKMDAAYQGQGYMREAAQHILTHAFNTLGLHRIEANIMPRNARSIALACDLGFSLEGYSPRYLRINNQWEDHLRFALIRDDA